LKRVVKRHLLGARIRENAAKTRGDGVVQTIIGPESDAAATRFSHLRCERWSAWLLINR
jgi:hypothetical protein